MWIPIPSWAAGFQSWMWFTGLPTAPAAPKVEEKPSIEMAGGYSFWGGGNVLNRGDVAALKASGFCYMVVDERIDSGGTLEIIQVAIRGRPVVETYHGPLRDSSRPLTHGERSRWEQGCKDIKVKANGV